MQEPSILLGINKVNLELFKVITARYKKMGLDVTPIQSRIIMYIYDSDDFVCQRDIEQFISCNKSTISSVLNTMEKNELILRKGSIEDLRRKNITLTDKSIHVATILSKDKNVVDNILCENISDEEYNIFSEVLEKIMNNLERI